MNTVKLQNILFDVSDITKMFLDDDDGTIIIYMKNDIILTIDYLNDDDRMIKDFKYLKEEKEKYDKWKTELLKNI